jgi:toxin ParE1/3/4
MRKVRFRPRAWEDTQDSAEYLANEGSSKIAERFLDAIEELTHRLIGLPQLGAHCRFSDPQLCDLRRIPVSGFRKWMVFYRESKGGIEVIRVLHGARDIASILDSDA